MTQYVPKPDVEGINYSAKKSPLQDALILVLGFFGVLLVAFFLIVGVTDWLAKRISLESELSFVGKLWPHSRSDRTKEFDNLVDRINAHLPFKMNAIISCDTEPNAFALPGGFVIVTSGLLKSIESENALSFVLGHEAGHIINRDHLRGFSRRILFGLMAGVLGLEDMGGFGFIGPLIETNYSQGQESSADEFGIVVVQQLYGHTWGAEQFFLALNEKESVFAKTLAKYAGSHPPTENRIARIRETQLGEPQPLTMPTSKLIDWAVELKCSGN